jgi:cell division protease FtsH
MATNDQNRSRSSGARNESEDSKTTQRQRGSRNRGKGRSDGQQGDRQQTSNRGGELPRGDSNSRDRSRGSSNRDRTQSSRSHNDNPRYPKRDGQSTLGHPTSQRGKREETSPERVASTPRQPRSTQKRRSSGRWGWIRSLTFMGLAILLAVVLWRTMNTSRVRDTINYSEFVSEYLAPTSANDVTRIRVMGKRLEITLKATDSQGRIQRRSVYLGPLEITPQLTNSWINRGISVEFQPANHVWSVILSTLPFAAIIIVIVFLFRQAQGSQRGLFNFSRSRAKEFSESLPSVTFDDVAGLEEAKLELQEVVEFLKEPARFQRLGGRIPRGMLMVGPPGTGKTYLARAIAGEARVPFFSISGSDFVEMYVGVGASRVRDLFERAKAKAPCIVFIDEIDAVGRKRSVGTGIGGGRDEREQTLNQLLVEMDGFNTNDTVILIAATNRPDVLDPALLRPGRFDRQVEIDMPDVRGREGVLTIHSRNVPLAPDVDFESLARGTPGLSGADLKNLVNEAALLGARTDQSSVMMNEFERAKEKVMWGIERRSLVMSDNDRQVTAVHEAGHALAGLLTKGSDPVHKVSIVPRGKSLGLTSYIPDAERYTVSMSWCMAKLVSMLGGRVAESLVFNEVTSGAADDLEAASELARRMVCEWGMSERLGAVAFETPAGEATSKRKLSEQTLIGIDEEVRRIIDEAMAKAREELQRNRGALNALSQALIVQEVLERPQIEEIIRDNATVEYVEPPVEDSGESRPRVVERPARNANIARRSRSRPKDSGRRTVDEDKVSKEPPKREVTERETAKAPEEEPVEAVAPKPESKQTPSPVERPAPKLPRRRRIPDPPRSRDQVPEPNEVEKSKQAEPSVAIPPELAEATVETAVQPELNKHEKAVPKAVEPEETTEPAAPAAFGRTQKIRKRSALRKSEVPETGTPVADITAETVSFGRGARAAKDQKELQWRRAQKGEEIVTVPTPTEGIDARKATEQPEPIEPSDVTESTHVEAHDPQSEVVVDIMSDTETEGIQLELVGTDSDGSDAAEVNEVDTAQPESDESIATETESDTRNESPGEMPDAETIEAPTESDTVTVADAVVEAPPEVVSDDADTTGSESVETKAEPAQFGRQSKRVKRSALKSSEAPKSGVAISAVVDGEISYGRSLRAADEDKVDESDEKDAPTSDAPVDSDETIVTESEAETIEDLTTNTEDASNEATTELSETELVDAGEPDPEDDRTEV